MATDLITLDQKVVIHFEESYEYGLDLDIEEKKLYYSNQKHIYGTNLDVTDNKTIIANASANDIAIDWKGNRIFWNDYAGKEIFAANLDGKEKKVVMKSENSYVMSIAFDPVAG